MEFKVQDERKSDSVNELHNGDVLYGDDVRVLATTVTVDHAAVCCSRRLSKKRQLVEGKKIKPINSHQRGENPLTWRCRGWAPVEDY